MSIQECERLGGRRSALEHAGNILLHRLACLVGIRALLGDPFVDRILEQMELDVAARGLVALGDFFVNN